ncbi:MAG: amidohydrolase family protein [Fimbriimonadaceae bacterium]|nr:amidohydrolase family protein [Chitinophagales bacterium]
MRHITADIIFPITSQPMKEKVLLISDDGQIIGIKDVHEFTEGELERYQGALIPGLINTHCHLELSHLKNKFPEKTGLVEFLLQVTKLREADIAEKQIAMEKADAEMYKNGIVAVGDISNTIDSFPIKSKRNIHYHTFVELLSIDPFKVFAVMQNGEKLLASARGFGIHASLAAHAPYSVSIELVKMISRNCYENGKPTTIHMLESNDENEFYLQGSGMIRKLYRELNIPLNEFKPPRKTSLESLLPYFNRNIKTLLVHNTIATTWDADWAEDLHPNLFWCFCPNANLYIEDRLPDILMLMDHVQYITIGTDSLASNHQLSILEELKTIQKIFPEIKTPDMLRWATLYGAKFLGIDDTFGSFDIGKRPGINVIEGIDLINYSLSVSHIKRII